MRDWDSENIEDYFDDEDDFLMDEEDDFGDWRLFYDEDDENESESGTAFVPKKPNPNKPSTGDEIKPERELVSN